jgi:hypothetical protein
MLVAAACAASRSRRRAPCGRVSRGLAGALDGHGDGRRRRGGCGRGRPCGRRRGGMERDRAPVGRRGHCAGTNARGERTTAACLAPRRLEGRRAGRPRDGQRHDRQARCGGYLRHGRRPARAPARYRAGSHARRTRARALGPLRGGDPERHPPRARSSTDGSDSAPWVSRRHGGRAASAACRA